MLLLFLAVFVLALASTVFDKIDLKTPTGEDLYISLSVRTIIENDLAQHIKKLETVHTYKSESGVDMLQINLFDYVKILELEVERVIKKAKSV